eukprot:jgi/Mesvir1/14124/Mv21137-RA.1
MFRPLFTSATVLMTKEQIVRCKYAAAGASRLSTMVTAEHALELAGGIGAHKAPIPHSSFRHQYRLSFRDLEFPEGWKRNFLVFRNNQDNGDKAIPRPLERLNFRIYVLPEQENRASAPEGSQPWKWAKIDPSSSIPALSEQPPSGLAESEQVPAAVQEPEQPRPVVVVPEAVQRKRLLVAGNTLDRPARQGIKRARESASIEHAEALLAPATPTCTEESGSWH